MASSDRHAPERFGFWRPLGMAAAGWFLFAVVNALQVYVSMLGHQHSLPRLVAHSVAVWWVWALLTPAVLRLAVRYPLLPLNRGLALHLVLAPLLSLLHLVAAAALTAWIEPFDVRNPDGFVESFLLGSLWLRFQLELVVYASLVALGTALAARRRLRRREQEAARLEVQLAEAKLHALELQLRPHFLFNTLHTVAGLVRAGENRQAVETIGRLGDLLHQTLETERTPRIPLDREMALLTAYLDLERLRFCDRLAVEVEVDPAARSALVPPFVLQPLAENAIRHGIAATAGPAVLRVSARRLDGRVEIDLYNSGPPLAGARRGLGLRNTRERLHQLYGTRAELSLEDAPGGVRARLAVPFEAAPAASEAAP